MTSFVIKGWLSTILFCNILIQLGFLKSIYWIYWMCSQAILSWVSWPQPNVTQVGNFYIVNFTIKNKRCKLICQEGPYIIDIMEDPDHSVRDKFSPFFRAVPVNIFQHSDGKELTVFSLNQDESQSAYIPREISELG